jgi:hypothetical protein
LSPTTRRIISHGACLVGDKPTVIKLWQTALKSNRYLHLKAGVTSFPRGELQKCHEIDHHVERRRYNKKYNMIQDLPFCAEHAQ